MSFRPFRRLLGLIYPELCPVCGVRLQEDEPFFCTACAYHLPRMRYGSFTDNPVCDKLAGKVRFDRAAAWLLYEKESSVQALFEEFKYRGNHRLAQQLGFMAGQSFMGMSFGRVDSQVGCRADRQVGCRVDRQNFFSGIDVIIPVPLHPEKLEKRGYNQSEWIAKGLSQATGLPVDTTSVCRRSATATQTRKNYWQRQKNVEDVFALTSQASLASLAGKHVLIIDDVLTTGATMSSCAQTVWQAHASNISFLSLAMA